MAGCKMTFPGRRQTYVMHPRRVHTKTNMWAAFAIHYIYTTTHDASSRAPPVCLSMNINELFQTLNSTVSVNSKLIHC